MKTAAKALLLSALALTSGSCDKAGQGTAGIPPLKVGNYYDIRFPGKPEGMTQNSFRVVAVGEGSWVQVETYPPTTLGMIVITALGSKDGSDAKRKEMLERWKKEKKLTWLNLQMAVSIEDSDPKTLGILKDI